MHRNDFNSSREYATLFLKINECEYVWIDQLCSSVNVRFYVDPLNVQRMLLHSRKINKLNYTGTQRFYL